MLPTFVLCRIHCCLPASRQVSLTPSFISLMNKAHKCATQQERNSYSAGWLITNSSFTLITSPFTIDHSPFTISFSAKALHGICKCRFHRLKPDRDHGDNYGDSATQYQHPPRNTDPVHKILQPAMHIIPCKR